MHTMAGSPVMWLGSFKPNKEAPRVCLPALPTINHWQWQVDYDSRSASTTSSEETEFPRKVEQKEEGRSHRKTFITRRRTAALCKLILREAVFHCDWHATPIWRKRPAGWRCPHRPWQQPKPLISHNETWHKLKVCSIIVFSQRGVTLLLFSQISIVIEIKKNK